MDNKYSPNKELPIFDNELFSAGLFNLEEFIGYPISVVNKYFQDKGWQQVDCFNDYKWAWTKADLGKSIIVKVDITDDESMGFEVVNSISSYDGIYSESD